MIEIMTMEVKMLKEKALSDIQHLDLHRHDLDHLEKTPATTSLAASLSALDYQPPANTRRARQGGRKGILSAQPPD